VRVVVVAAFLIFGFTPSFAQIITEFPLPATTDQAGNICVVPAGATQNPKLSKIGLQRFIAAEGYVWFTNVADNSIGRMDSFGNVVRYPLKTKNAGPVGCAFGPSNGLLYFAEQSPVPAKVGVLDPTSDPRWPILRELPMPAPNSGAAGVAFDAAGVLNIMIPRDSAIQRMKPGGTFLRPIQLPPGRWPHGPALCGGKLIFAENGANRFASLTTSGVLVERLLPENNSKPFAFTCGTDGLAYGTLNGIGKIVQVDPASTGLLKQFAIPSGRASAPMGVATGFDGNIYFANSASNTIGKLTYSGASATISEAPVPSAGVAPNKITPCFATAVCFGEQKSNAIGVLSW
jgi:virginiamycin B lyase